MRILECRLSGLRPAKGAIHQVILALKERAVNPIGPTTWSIQDIGVVDVLLLSNPKTIFTEIAVQAIWMELSRSRSGYEGLSRGLDYGPTIHYSRTLKQQVSMRRLRAILQNEVWTPVRAARVNTGTSECLHCGAHDADIEHL